LHRRIEDGKEEHAGASFHRKQHLIVHKGEERATGARVKKVREGGRHIKLPRTLVARPHN